MSCEHEFGNHGHQPPCPICDTQPAPETSGNVTRLEPPNTKLARICDIYDELIREMRRQGFETLQGVYDGMRIRVDRWPESAPDVTGESDAKA